jgi:hypothetical protein
VTAKPLRSIAAMTALGGARAAGADPHGPAGPLPDASGAWASRLSTIGAPQRCVTPCRAIVA